LKSSKEEFQRRVPKKSYITKDEDVPCCSSFGSLGANKGKKCTF